jgi:hypothetical protein
MNQKKAKALRKTAKSIYQGETQYEDQFYRVDPEDEHLKFMDGALAKRVMKDGSTRKMYKDLKKGANSKLLNFEYKTPKGMYQARRYRAQES